MELQPGYVIRTKEKNTNQFDIWVVFSTQKSLAVIAYGRKSLFPLHDLSLFKTYYKIFEIRSNPQLGLCDGKVLGTDLIINKNKILITNTNIF